MEFEISDAELDAADQAGRQFERDNPKAAAARYDAASGRLVVEFQNGASFMVPARQLQDLEDASDADLAAVELHHDHFLRWSKLDVDFTIPGLMAGLFGTARYMAQKAGQARSPAKAAASRENGKKGGRPRKAPSAA